jgi:predicted aspartyl protease
LEETRIGATDLESADNQFKAGMFAQAERTYARIVGKEPQNHGAIARLGYIALLTNRLDDAQKWLTEAIILKPDDSTSKSMLAEVHYRRDEFQQAAQYLCSIGKEVKAKKLESFKDVTPYTIDGKTGVTTLPFVMTDPLPVVQVQVDNSGLVNFLIDTGGAEVIIDDDFAREVGTTDFGSETGTFAGGKQAGFQHGRVESITLGDFIVRHIPVHMMNVRRFSQPIFGGKRVDGIIGTVLLYHFFATVNYPDGQLILRRRTEENLKQVDQEAAEQGSIAVPFWMAGDHYMMASGTVNNSEPMLFFVDTGLAGGGFSCRESTLQKAGIELQMDKAREGIGGGGKVTAIPFAVDTLTLGDAKEHNIRGIYTPNAGALEKVVGFHIGGLISHMFFRHYSLTFDFDGMRLFLKRRS